MGINELLRCQLGIVTGIEAGAGRKVEVGAGGGVCL